MIKLLRNKVLLLINVIIGLQLTIQQQNIYAQNLQPGFALVQVATGLLSPTAAAVAPDGRIFIAQQNGKIAIIKNGNLLGFSFASISVGQNGERGLIGIALDPDFATNNYVYIHYTVPNQSMNKISRITANGDKMLAGSETTILLLDSLGPANMHNGGGLKFGPDGKLYISVGENTVQSNSQSLNTYKGKLLRINKDGTVPTGNPYPSGSAAKRRTWAMGLRNPFTFDIQPVTGRIFVNDVGSNYSY